MNPIRLLSLAVLAAMPTLAAQEPTSAAATGAKLTLKVTAKKGAKQCFSVSSSQVSVLEAMGGQEQGQEQVAELAAEVLEANEAGELTVRITWKSVRGKMTTMMGEVSYDSAKPDSAADDPTGGMVSAMLTLAGKSVEAIVTPNGEIKEIKGIKQLADEMAKSVEGPARMMLQGLISEPALKRQLGLFGALPSEPVAVGGTWSRKHDASANSDAMKMKVDSTLKLEEASAERYVISLSGKIEREAAKGGDEAAPGGDEAGGQMRAMMAQAKVSNGKVEGKATISRQDGMVLSSISTTTMDIEMPNPMGGDEPFKVSVKQIQKIERAQEAPKDGAPAPGAGR